MAEFTLTNRTVEDLSEIWNYTVDKWSEIQADKYYTINLLNYCRDLAEHPGSGKNYEIVTAGLLGFNVNRHIIFYRIVSSNEIEVVRILHEMMDLRNRI